MIEYFAANDIAAFSIVSGSPVEVTSNIDTTYCARGIQPNGGVLKSAQFITPTTGAATSVTNVWVHFDFYTGFFGGVQMEFLDSAGTSVLRIYGPSNGVYRLDYWSGTAWVTGAATYNAGTGVRIACDVHIVCGATGSFTMYSNGTQVLQLTSLSAAVDNIAFIQPNGGSGQQTYSQFLASDTNTIGAKVASLKTLALGADTAWSPNTAANIDKTSFNDATFISDSTLGDKVTYTAADATMPAGMFVSSLWFATRARLNAASPANITPLLRISGTDYAGAYNLGGLNSTTFGPAVAAFTTDPSTSAAWTLTNANLAELGFKTAA